jgi:Flp pilus assembly protein TadD/AraC-like DNA-binding protein
MTSSKSIDRITEILRNSELTWLLPNLRQDFVVWNTLNEPAFFDKFIQSKPDGSNYIPEDFAPSNLALLVLGQTNKTGSDPKNLIDSIDQQVVQTALHRLNEQTIIQANPQDLANSGLIALALANNFRVTNTWNGLLNAIQAQSYKTWLAPISCLFGYVGDSIGLLNALVQPGAPSSRYKLAIHAVLSNPLPPADQVDTLIRLCYGAYDDLLPPTDRLTLVRDLFEQRPQIAVDFCKKWLEIHPDFANQINQNPRNIARTIDQLAEFLFQIDVREFASKSQDLADLITAENTLTQNLYIDLVNQSVIHKSRYQTKKLSTQDLSDNFGKLIQLSGIIQAQNNYSGRSADFDLTLANQGLIEKAKKLLPRSDEPLPDDIEILYAIAELSLQIGNHQRSLSAASRITELLDHAFEGDDIPIWGEGFSQVNFGILLLDLHKPADASHMFELALHTCPNDASLLKLLADSYISSHLDQLAAETLHQLVSLNPDHLPYRRDYAQSLADIGDWEACLNERSIIINSNPAAAKSQHADDYYAYAHCALQANHPELTLNICNDLLSDNQEDSRALIYAGEAHLLMADTNKGLEFLVRATQVSPNLAEAWLALARAQQKIYPLETVIETLKNATQAVPNSSQIHFMLGNLYLQDGTPTLALPDLQTAIESSPNDPQIMLSLGQALTMLGHNEEAKGVLAKAYGLDPRLPGLAQLYAKILVDMGDLEEAISPLELLIDTKTQKDSTPYLDYARCVLTLHKRGSVANPPMKALIALNEVLQIDPENAEAKALSAEALAANGEKELAFQAFREALDTSLVEDKGWFERLSFGFGCIASSIGKHDIAIAALQEAGQVNPNNVSVFMALSDAYYSANLPEDAIRSARNVLVIDGDNPDNLAWYAKQIEKFIHDQKQDGSNSPVALKGLSSEALTALNKAILLAPTRTDLLLQLGNFQTSLGACDEAKVIFASIASLDFATIDDLKKASEYLSGIGDHLSAIECLEKGIDLDQKSSTEHNPSIYTSLAHEYVSNHDYTSAINTLDKAIDIIPNDRSLISLKIDILLGLGQSIDALHCIESALQTSPAGKPNIDLLFLASRINRSMGDFSAAIKYTKIGTEIIHQQNASQNLTILSIKYRTQIADLYRALLQHDQAYQFVRDEINPDSKESGDGFEYLDYICLQAELALENGELIKSSIQEVKVESSHPSFSRLMAINARLLNKAGNYKQAGQLFQIAINKLANPDQTNNPPNWSAPYIKYVNLISIIEAALDLGFWDQAISCTREVIELTAGEPLPHLYLARALILKAEYYHLCEILEVTKHKPSLNAGSAESYIQCTQYLDQAKATLETYHNDRIGIEQSLTYDQIYRWRARSNIAFEQHDEQIPDPCEFLAHQPTFDDATSQISHLHRLALRDPDSDALTKIIKIARLNPRNPAVILRVALALNDNNPANAMKTLQSVLQQNPYSKSPVTAFCNFLLAKIAFCLEELEIAKQAVEAAIEFWQDEPCWHSLAARIYIKSSDVNDATTHLLEASRLAPENITYHMDLGRLYFENANADPHMLGQALESFESALALDQNDVSALINLASTQCLMNDLEKAESNARNALILAPNRADIYQLLSEIAIKNNDFQGAYEYANKAILANPKDIQSTVTLVKSLSALGRHNEALAKLNTIIPTVQDTKWLHLERVSILRKMNGPRSALHELIDLTNSYPDEFNILNALSKTYLELGESENALSVAQHALKVCTDKSSHNEQANLHLMIGQVMRQSGQLDQSIQHLSEAIQLAPDRLEPYLELGLARKERREYQQALQIFERATLIAPDDPRAPYQAGLALKESKDYKSSETMLRKAVSLAPNDLTIRRQLAAVVALNLVHNPHSGRNYGK